MHVRIFENYNLEGVVPGPKLSFQDQTETSAIKIDQDIDQNQNK